MSRFDLFLSHASEDKPKVRELARDLRTLGFAVWLDEEQVRPGDSIVEQIIRGLERSRFLGVCVSGNLRRSRWVRAEYSPILQRELRSGRRSLLPLIIDDFEESDVPLLLVDKRWLDVRTREGRSELARHLQASDAIPSEDSAATAERCRGHQAHLLDRIEERLLQLPDEPAELGSWSLRILSEEALELERMLENPPREAKCRRRLEDACLLWQSFVEGVQRRRPDDFAERLLHERFLRITRAFLRSSSARRSRFAGGESRAGAQGGGGSTEGASAAAGLDRCCIGHPPPPEELAVMIDRGDLYDRKEALSLLLRGGAARRSRRIDRTVSASSGRRLSRRIWPEAANILVHTRSGLRELLDRLVPTDSEYWGPRNRWLQGVTSRSTRVERAEAILAEAPESERTVLCQFLAIHPSRACRRLGRAGLPLGALWDLATGRKMRLLLLRELVQSACSQAPDPFVRALFLLVRPRLAGARSRLELEYAYRAMVHFYRRSLFLEDADFELLQDLHEALRETARLQALTSIDEAYAERFLKILHKRPLEGETIYRLSHVPVTIQRRLARRGHHPKVFICNVRDPIADETIPHVRFRDDVHQFLALPAINSKALEKLGSDERVHRVPRNRFVFCRNPRAQSYLVKRFVGQLGRRELQLLAEDRHAAQSSRELARRQLAVG